MQMLGVMQMEKYSQLSKRIFPGKTMQPTTYLLAKLLLPFWEVLHDQKFMWTDTMQKFLPGNMDETFRDIKNMIIVTHFRVIHINNRLTIDRGPRTTSRSVEPLEAPCK
jgi:hypothetical protein